MGLALINTIRPELLYYRQKKKKKLLFYKAMDSKIFVYGFIILIFGLVVQLFHN